MILAMLIIGILKVTVSIPPLVEPVKAIGGDSIEVVCIVRGDETPHTFSPGFKEMKGIANSTVLFYISNRLEMWIDKITNAMPKDAKIVELCSVIDTTLENPHIWLSVSIMERIVEAIALTLQSYLPEDYIQRNKEAYLERLSPLRQLIEELQKEKLKALCIVPAFHHLLNECSIENIGTVIPHPGTQPSLKRISTLITRAKQRGVNIILASKQYPTPITETVSKSIGIEPIELEVVGRKDYIQFMMENLGKIKGK